MTTTLTLLVIAQSICLLAVLLALGVIGKRARRDYFAAKAMPEIYLRVTTGGFKRAATLSYEMADAMLAARKEAA